MKKVDYWANRYGIMHRGIHPHAFHLDADNIGCLDRLDLGFVFVCVDRGDVKGPIVAKLEELGLPFVDVGMGLELAEAVPFYEKRHCVKPGITGWAQMNYPYGASMEDTHNKLEFDLYYVKHQSLFLDFLVLLQTAEVILFGKGAR